MVGNSTQGQNIGSGCCVYKGKSTTNTLQFKTISATGTSIQLFSDADNIYISGATGGSGESTITGATIPLYITNKNICLDFIDNIYLGTDAGINNTGSNQIALGYRAGYFNIGGAQVAIGCEAGFFNSGSTQVAIGYGAGYCNLCYNQVAIGNSAGACNSGEFQSVIGINAGQLNSGFEQVGLGFQAGYCNWGSYEIGIGGNAGMCNSGDYLIAIGLNNGYRNTGDNVIGIGYNMGNGNTISNRLLIGHNTPLIDGSFSANTMTVCGKSQSTSDFESLTNGCGVILKSPDGTRYRLTVPNGGGSVTITAV